MTVDNQDDRDDSEADSGDAAKGPSFPAGTFRARADWESVALGWNKDHTSEVISVRLRVTDKLFPDVIGKSITWYGKFATQNNERFAIKDLRAMGWDSGPLGKPGGEDGALGGLGEPECEIVVAHREWDGKVRAEVKYVNAIGGMGFKEPLDGGALAKLNARVMRGQAATAPRPQPAQAPGGRQNVNPPPRAAAQQARPRHTTERVPPEPVKPAAQYRDPGLLPARPLPAPMANDEDRLRAIDRGEDARPPPDDDDIPY